jgi:hypothetical protein
MGRVTGRASRGFGMVTFRRRRNAALPIDVLRAECYLSPSDSTNCNGDPYGNNNANVYLWELALAGADINIHESCACAPSDPMR